MKLIPLSQKGKYAGMYSAMVDDEDYDWLNQWNWQIRSRGRTYYAIREMRVNGKVRRLLMHRGIMSVGNPKIFIDHKDGNGLNNQRSNLRLATHAQNMANRRSQLESTSRYLGVCRFLKRPCKKSRTGDRWQAHIRINGKHTTLGFFCSEEDAARAYNEAAKKYHGEFANLNIIQDDI